MNRIIDILIPTYNRCEFLAKNIQLLVQQISEANLQDQVAICVSDNCSSDHTQATVQELIQANPTISIYYHRQNTNIGLEPNVVDLMGRAVSPYVMWIGDDDYIADGYLAYCVAQIQEQNIGCIIPGLKNLNADGTVVDARNESFASKTYEPGYETMWAISHLAHQMSGILLTRDSLLESYLDKPAYRNPYLFIFWTADCLFRLGGIYAPIYKTGITTFNAKDWGYNQVGLLDEVFKSYYYFESKVSPIQLRELLLRFSKMHSYRYNIRKYEPLKLLKKYKILCSTLPIQLRGFNYHLALHLIKDYAKSWL
ncbi:glycosyltransferase family 2 protein [Reichenbachiella agarivorans]|uniref:Glycosyltransferase family 2 protein n=1 Tax=Reichenbachiella agarivorans TaxID=2979464 RepID=A0ABY6CR18_9BACT|nr:glycosyltransferase family 2 protein [Reichenbachiella agarivorans]UXP32942.1 glycosyltransferase family 2 protein [Reichenbachiella agarivorans]